MGVGRPVSKASLDWCRGSKPLPVPDLGGLMVVLRLLGPGPWRALLRRRRKKKRAKASRARNTAAPPRLPPMMGPRRSEEPEATGMEPAGAEVESGVPDDVVAVLEVGWLVVREVVDVVEDWVADVEEDLEAVDLSTVLMEMRVSNRENGVPVGRSEGLPNVAVANTVVPRLLAVPHPNMDMPPSKKFL